MKFGIFRHYKGNLYEVIGIATHSETLEKLVVYRALYGEKSLWVRPYEMFIENIKVDDKVVSRFKYVSQ